MSSCSGCFGPMVRQHRMLRLHSEAKPFNRGLESRENKEGLEVHSLPPGHMDMTSGASAKPRFLDSIHQIHGPLESHFKSKW